MKLLVQSSKRFHSGRDLNRLETSFVKTSIMDLSFISFSSQDRFNILVLSFTLVDCPTQLTLIFLIFEFVFVSCVSWQISTLQIWKTQQGNLLHSPLHQIIWGQLCSTTWNDLLWKGSNLWADRRVWYWMRLGHRHKKVGGGEPNISSLKSFPDCSKHLLREPI